MEIEGEIIKISHRTIGEIVEIDTRGLTYRIKLISGEEIVVEAEETPGKIENDYPPFDNDNWCFLENRQVLFGVFPIDAPIPAQKVMLLVYTPAFVGDHN